MAREMRFCPPPPRVLGWYAWVAGVVWYEYVGWYGSVVGPFLLRAQIHSVKAGIIRYDQTVDTLLKMVVARGRAVGEEGGGQGGGKPPYSGFVMRVVSQCVGPHAECTFCGMGCPHGPSPPPSWDRSLVGTSGQRPA